MWFGFDTEQSLKMVVEGEKSGLRRVTRFQFSGFACRGNLGNSWYVCAYGMYDSGWM